MIEIVIAVLGIIVGCIGTLIYLDPKDVGTLVVAKEGDTTSLYLQLKEEPDSLRKAKYALFKISHK